MSRAKTTPTRSFVHVGCARLFCYRSCEVAAWWQPLLPDLV